MTGNGHGGGVERWVAATYGRLADLLGADPGAADAPSLCAGWRARPVRTRAALSRPTD